MSLLILTLVFQVHPYFASAQEKEKPNEVETLFGDKASNGGYGGILLGYTKIAERNAITTSVKGAWIIDHGIGIGFAGTGFFSEMKSDIIPNEEWSAITGGYGGLLIEPIFFGTKPVHISVPLLIGGGAIVYGNNYDYYGYTDYTNFFDYYFIFEPAIELEFNLTRFFRLATGVSYRFASDMSITRTYNDIDYEVVKPGDLDNFSVYLVFKFGKF